MKTEYEIKAEDFLKKVGATMTVEFVGNMKHFDDDKEKRDVYDITLTRGNKSFTFRFGQSIAKSGDKVKRNKPTAYDVLSIVQKYDVGTFENFCGDFGYDTDRRTDRRKAEKTYFAVQKEYDNIETLFGDVMDELSEIN